MKLSKPKIWAIGAVLVLILIYIFWPSANVNNSLTATARMDHFENLVVCSGELMAENSRQIKGPEGMQRYRIYDLKISDIIPEGTVVKEGDYIASLDKSDLSTRINDTELDLEKAESQYTQVRLDTALSLRDARDNIRNLEFQRDQAELTLEQSKFEPPATIKQAELNVQKAKRAINEARENYLLKQKQSGAKMREAQSNLQKQRNRLDNLMEIQSKFTIFAPDTGMLIYEREWGGGKVKTGSQISTWDPVVGTLPDLSSMLSKTYINEVDISKVRTGQNVNISLDAFPSAQLKGEVKEVANMGETRKGDDTKVFEVIIQVTESDSAYRPGMTTSNQIITHSQESVLMIPVEAIFGDNEHVWVYRKTATSAEKVEVKTGEANDVDIIILEGIKEGDEVLLSEPENAESLDLIALQ